MMIAHAQRVDGGQRRYARRSVAVRGIVLLEVLLALALLLLGMAAVGSQVNVSLKVARDTDVATRAVMLAESKLSELDAGVVRIERNQELEGDFGRQYPGWAWRMQIEPCEVDDLNFISLEILYEPGIGFDEPADIRDMKIVHTLYTLRATPAKVDLQRDFGFSDDELEQLAEQIPLPGFDPQNIDPSMLADLDADTLMEYLPDLMSALGGASGLLNALPQATRAQLKQQLQNGGRGGAGNSADEAQLQDALNTAGPDGLGGNNDSSGSRRQRFGGRTGRSSNRSSGGDNGPREIGSPGEANQNGGAPGAGFGRRDRFGSRSGSRNGSSGSGSSGSGGQVGRRGSGFGGSQGGPTDRARGGQSSRPERPPGLNDSFRPPSEEDLFRPPSR